MGGEVHPYSFAENNAEEVAVLEHVETFRKQFTQLYPQRPTLLLTPKNEYGAEVRHRRTGSDEATSSEVWLNDWRDKKLVCTTIKPTKLPFKELSTVEGCAKFVADYFQYKTLIDPYALVRTLSLYHFQSQKWIRKKHMMCMIWLN